MRIKLLSLTVTELHRFRVYGNRLLGKISGPKKNKLSNCSTNLHTEKLAISRTIRFQLPARRDTALCHNIQIESCAHPASYPVVPSVGINWCGHRDNHSTPFSAQVKNPWSYNHIPMRLLSYELDMLLVIKSNNYGMCGTCRMHVGDEKCIKKFG